MVESAWKLSASIGQPAYGRQRIGQPQNPRIGKLKQQPYRLRFSSTPSLSQQGLSVANGALERARAARRGCHDTYNSSCYSVVSVLPLGTSARCRGKSSCHSTCSPAWRESLAKRFGRPASAATGGGTPWRCASFIPFRMISTCGLMCPFVLTQPKFPSQGPASAVLHPNGPSSHWQRSL
ncbi:hypothetical protein C8D77_1381 [Mesorhizobium loti]|uniref:Uncharacterized protein n=1 Tax=Rhizobium loti TaxID=381 RepID=A0A8E2W516_RHILI|nr:hypothetical protein C8D77_1381 [Mesorhizobium loti]